MVKNDCKALILRELMGEKNGRTRFSLGIGVPPAPSQEMSDAAIERQMKRPAVAGH